MDLLLQIDTTFFHLINGYLSNPLFDMIMPIFHHTKHFLPFLILPWILAIILDGKNRWKLAFLIPLAIILVDQSGLLIKKTILRPRPFVIINPEIINHLVKPSGINLSFPSNHAAIAADQETKRANPFSKQTITTRLLRFFLNAKPSRTESNCSEFHNFLTQTTLIQCNVNRKAFRIFYMRSSALYLKPPLDDSSHRETHHLNPATPQQIFILSQHPVTPWG